MNPRPNTPASPAAQPRLEPLESCLTRMMVLYEQLEQRMHEKRDAIIQGNLDNLLAIDTRVAQLTQETQRQEVQRLAMMPELGYSSDCPLTIVIEEAANRDEQLRLKNLRNQLRLSVERVSTLSQSNQDLLNQSLRFVEQSMTMISELVSPAGASYSARGQQVNRHTVAEGLTTSTVCIDG